MGVTEGPEEDEVRVGVAEARTVEDQLRDIKSMFNQGAMTAFGKNEKEVFNRIETIRHNQLSLVKSFHHLHTQEPSQMSTNFDSVGDQQFEELFGDFHRKEATLVHEVAETMDKLGQEIRSCFKLDLRR